MRKFTHTWQTNWSKKLNKYVPGLAAVAVFGGLGTAFLLTSHAATPAASIESENGTLSSAAANVTDSMASSNHAVKFGSGGALRTLNCTPAAASTMTNTVSHLCGYPDTTNTGVPAGTHLVAVNSSATDPPNASLASDNKGWHWDSRGWLEIDTDGAVLDGVSLSEANIDVQANNVTIKNCYVSVSGESSGVDLRHTSNVTVQDSTIFSPTSSGPNRLLVGIKDVYGDTIGTKVLRNNIYHASTGVQMATGLIQDNYIHDMGLNTGDHVNGTTSNAGDSHGLTISHNTSFNQIDETDAISLFEDFGGQHDATIDNNLVAGGGYTIYGGQNAGGAATYNIRITNNHFSRMFYPNSGSYGPVTAWSSGTGNVWSGNIWDDTGATINP